jgi:hypothetical protein
MDTSKIKGTILNSYNNTPRKLFGQINYFLYCLIICMKQTRKKFDTNYLEEKIKEGFGEGCLFIFLLSGLIGKSFQMKLLT